MTGSKAATSKKKSGAPDLSAKRDLIIHAYDSFLAAQTRLFSVAHSVYNYLGTEIAQKQKFLLLDDLVSFAINGRRLIELTSLKSFSNSLRIPLSTFDDRSEPREILRTKSQVGFLTLLNGIIHAKDVYYFNNRLDVIRMFRDVDVLVLYRIIDKATREKRWNEYSLEPSIFVVPERGDPTMVCLTDVIAASVEILEKIVEVCSDSTIFLEFEHRGGT